jgi:hypothetical protein
MIHRFSALDLKIWKVRTSATFERKTAMKFTTLMVIKAAVCLGFGPLLLFFPDPLLTLLGSSYGPGAAITAREYGAALIGNLMLAWFARKAEASLARRAIILDLFVYDAVAFVAMLLIQASGGMNLLGWGVVAIYFFFTLGFGSFLLPGRNTA